MAYPDDNTLPHLLWALSIIFGLLPTIVVGLRFKVKSTLRNHIYLDDWLIVLAWASCIVFAIFVIIGVEGGRLGRPLRRDAEGEPIFDHEFFTYQKVSYVTNLIQITALGPTKLSVLFLYRRLFHVDGRAFNITSFVLIGIVTVWTIAFFFTNLLSYLPISDMWTKPPGEAQGTFDNVVDMYNAQCFSDMALDVIIVTIPIPSILKLQISLAKKLQILCIFLLGLFTIGASVARAVIQYHAAAEFEKGNPDQTYFLAPHIYWVLVEISVGIIAASLPLLRPLGRSFNPKNFMAKSAETFSRIFKTSSQSHSRLSGDETGKQDEESAIMHSVGAGSAKGQNWRDRRYDLSCLDQTVDNETRIEAYTMTDANEWSGDGGIRYEKNYQVTHTVNGGA